MVLRNVSTNLIGKGRKKGKPFLRHSASPASGSDDTVLASFWNLGTSVLDLLILLLTILTVLI